MQHSNAVILMNLLIDEDYEASIHDDYSGRGMYGRTTHSVTTSAIPNTVARLEGKNDLPESRTDNMGLDFVYY